MDKQQADTLKAIIDELGAVGGIESQLNHLAVRVAEYAEASLGISNIAHGPENLVKQAWDSLVLAFANAYRAEELLKRELSTK